MINETIEKHIGESVNEASYTNKELGRLDNNKNDVLVNAQFKDDNGNSTKWLGLNDTESLEALKKFVDERLKMIKKGMK
jgi:hypothetical protein